MNSTPCANACERNDSKESTPLRFIKKRIMRLPMPNIFICDNFSFKELDGSLQQFAKQQACMTVVGGSIVYDAQSEADMDLYHIMSTQQL